MQSSGNYAKHCCAKCSGQDINTKKCREQTVLKIYGSTNIFSSSYGKNKIIKTCLQRYGVPYSGMSDIKKQHTIESNINKYGVENVNQVQEIKIKGTNTSLQKHGHVFNYCKYMYDNKKFDSSWELMYYIYLKDHNIIFEYHKKGLFFKYYVNNKQKLYYPDFVVNSEIHEIKGNQFFNDNNEPYDKQHKCWWWEKYNCMLENNVKILRANDLEYVFQYIDEIYKISSLKQYLIIKNKINLSK